MVWACCGGRLCVGATRGVWGWVARRAGAVAAGLPPMGVGVSSWRRWSAVGRASGARHSAIVERRTSTEWRPGSWVRTRRCHHTLKPGVRCRALNSALMAMAAWASASSGAVFLPLRAGGGCRPFPSRPCFPLPLPPIQRPARSPALPGGMGLRGGAAGEEERICLSRKGCMRVAVLGWAEAGGDASARVGGRCCGGRRGG